jgi:O-antigen/teichoic acid export membrane protein
VRVFLVISFLALPVLLVEVLLHACLGGLERWRRLALARAIPFAVSFVAVVALYAAHDLTVGRAAGFAILGSVLAIVPALGLLREQGWPVFRARLAGEGIGFGLRAWLGEIALIANTRLDQLLMIALVSPRQLGLYVVATTLGGIVSTLTIGALAPPLMVRIAAGERGLLPQALRITLAATALCNAGLVLATPFLLPALFGAGFRDAVWMAIVLLAAALPFSGARVLSAALQADGAPLLPTVGEAIAIVVTVAGLLLFLRPLGGLGAALVSLAAYTASFAFQLTMARRRLGVGLREMLLPVPADLRWARGLIAHSRT